MIEAYFFDLDGTLLSTEILWIEAMKEAANARGIKMDMAEATEIVLGRALTDIFFAVTERYPAIFSDMRNMDNALYEHFVRLRSSRDTRIPGSVELLVKLADQGYPVAIVTGSPRRDLDNAIAELKIADKLAFSLSCEDYHIGKPDPTCYKMAADRLGIEYEKCCVFEDSTAGILSAKANGMKCVALVLKNMPAQNVTQADLILHNLLDFNSDLLA